MKIAEIEIHLREIDVDVAGSMMILGTLIDGVSLGQISLRIPQQLVHPFPLSGLVLRLRALGRLSVALPLPIRLDSAAQLQGEKTLGLRDVGERSGEIAVQRLTTFEQVK